MSRAWLASLGFSVLVACASSGLDVPAQDAGAERDGATAGAGFDPGSFAERPVAPRDVQASRDDPEAVRVQFAPGDDGPLDGFEVLRDGTRIASVAPSERSYLDADADPPAPFAPTGLVASQGNHEEGVELQWEAAMPRHGTPHVYTVVALREGVPSPPGGPATGWRGAADITAYELSRDDGRSWETLEGDSTTHLDTAAPAGEVVPGQAEVDALLRPARVVRLTVVGWEVRPARLRYRVRAVAQGAPGDASASAEGHRAVPPPSIQWQFADGDAAQDEAFSDLADATGPSWFDATLPRDRSRSYRATIRLGASVVAHSESGSAHPLPAVTAVAFGDGIDCVLYDGGVLGCSETSWGAPLDASAGPFVQITADYTLCALHEGGQRQCWGRNDFRNAPPAISGTRYVDIDVGSPLCMIRESDNLLECRGTFSGHERNDYPNDVPGRDVSVGDRIICMVELAGPLRCWGAASSYSLGPTEAHYTQVSVGNYARFCAVRDSGALECFTSPQAAPTTPEGADGLLFDEVAATVALTRDGQLFRFGRGIVDPDHRYVDIDGSCAVRDDGELFCSSEGDRLPLSGSYVDLHVGDDVCGVDEAGVRHCRLGEETVAGWPSELPTGEVRQYLRGNSALYVLDTEGRVRCAWDTRYPGYDPTADYPEAACLPSSARYASIEVLRPFVCGLRQDTSTIDCVRGSSYDPGPVELFEGRYAELSGSYPYLCALRAEGGVECLDRNGSPLDLREDFASTVTHDLRVSPVGICALTDEGRPLCSDGEPEELVAAYPEVRFEQLVGAFCGRTTEGHVYCWDGSNVPPWRWVGRYQRLASGPHGLCGLRDDGKIICDHPYESWDGRSLVTP